MNEKKNLMKQHSVENCSERECRNSHGRSSGASRISIQMSLTTKIISPALIALYLNHHSPLPMIITLYSSITLYLLELCRFRGLLLVGNCISFWVISMSLFYENYRWNDLSVWGFMSCFFDVSLVGCLVSSMHV
jgi:hypothetical protein